MIFSVFYGITLNVYEQDTIVDKLIVISTSIDKERRHLYKLNNIKKGLMQDLLTGKVSV